MQPGFSLVDEGGEVVAEYENLEDVLLAVRLRRGKWTKIVRNEDGVIMATRRGINMLAECADVL